MQAYAQHWEAERASLIEETQDAQRRADEHMARHFDSVQVIAGKTTLPALLPSVRARLFALVDVGAVTRRLREARAAAGDQGSVSAEEKVALWRELLRRAFARCVAALWAQALLDALVRVQLNVLGRHLFLDTAVAGSEAAAPGDTPASPKALASRGEGATLPVACQHRFLALADYFPAEGLPALVEMAYEAVDATMASADLQADLSPEALAAELRRASDRLAAAVAEREGGWSALLLPEGAEEVVEQVQAAANAEAVATPLTELANGSAPATPVTPATARSKKATSGGSVVGTPAHSVATPAGSVAPAVPPVSSGRDRATIRFLAAETRDSLRSQLFEAAARSAAAQSHEILAAALAAHWPAEGAAMTPVKGGDAAAAVETAAKYSGSAAASLAPGTPGAPGTPQWAAPASLPATPAAQAVTPSRVMTLKPLALAKLLPLVAGAAGAMLDPPTRNPYARATAQLPEVRELAAYVYTDLSY